MFTDGIFIKGVIIQIESDETSVVQWDDGMKSTEYKHDLKRLKPKKKITRVDLARFWDRKIIGMSYIRSSQIFNELCELVGVK